MHTIKMQDLPFGKFRDKGIPVDNVSNYASDKEEIVYIASQTELNLRQLIFVTEKSMMKIVDGGEFDVAKRTVAATKLSEGDRLIHVASLTDQQNIILQSKEGYFLRFPISEISEMKKTAVGVRGMKLGDRDLIENVYLTSNTDMNMIEYKNKSIMLNGLKGAHRDGKGTKVRA
jgi:DNA gyrase subunit A